MVKPHSSVPYALDAPVLPPHLSITAPGKQIITITVNVSNEHLRGTEFNAFSGSLSLNAYSGFKFKLLIQILPKSLALNW